MLSNYVVKPIGEFEMALKYTLVRECLNNIEDPAGRWQIEGGRVLEKDTHIARILVNSLTAWLIL